MSCWISSVLSTRRWCCCQIVSWSCSIVLRSTYQWRSTVCACGKLSTVETVTTTQIRSRWAFRLSCPVNLVYVQNETCNAVIMNNKGRVSDKRKMCISLSLALDIQISDFIAWRSPDCVVAWDFQWQNTSGSLCVLSSTSRARFAGKKLRLWSIARLIIVTAVNA